MSLHICIYIYIHIYQDRSPSPEDETGPSIDQCWNDDQKQAPQMLLLKFKTEAGVGLGKDSHSCTQSGPIN
jgi:hypothetical protein